MKNGKMLLLFFLVFSLRIPLEGQTDSENPEAPVSKEFDTSEFSQGVRDLRRAEIITFGSFPFTYLLASTLVDTYRTASHGWDARYAPWPFKPAAAIDRSADEQMITIGVAVISSVLVALADYGIHKYRRNKKNRAQQMLPEGTPIIIQRPLSMEFDPETGEEVPQAGAPAAGAPPDDTVQTKDPPGEGNP